MSKELAQATSRAASAVEPELQTPIEGGHSEKQLFDSKSNHDGMSTRSATQTVVEGDSSEHDQSGSDVAEEDPGAIERAESRPEAPYSVFSMKMKRFIVFMSTMSGLFSPIASFIYLPALDTLAKYYDQSIANINLSITTYQIMQGLSPMFFGNMADTIGRRPVYTLTFTIFLGANLGLGLQNSYAALMVLRAMQSAGSSPVIALGNAVVSDVATPAERGKWMGYVQAGVMLGPAIAPTIGGIFTQFLGWRWIFWFLLILNGTYLIIYLCIMPETCRNVVDDGSIPPPRFNRSLVQHIDTLRRKARGEQEPGMTAAKQRRAAELAEKRGAFRFPNPIASLRCIKEPDVALVMVYQAVMIGAFYSIMVPITPVFASTYNFNQLQIGLCYIPFSVGAAGGAIGFGRLLDWNFARTARRLGLKVSRRAASKLREFPIERARLEWIFIPNTMSAAGILCWGWALQAKPNLAGPLVLLAWIAIGATGSSTMVNTLLVDLYPQSPATVVAANNLVRCLFGAASSAVVQYMIDGLGLGWCYTVVAAISMLATLTLVADIKYGQQWREKRTLKLEAKEEEERKAKEASEREKRKTEEQEQVVEQEREETGEAILTKAVEAGK